MRGRCLAVPLPSAGRACTTRAARQGWRPASRGSINVEILEFLGLRNVAAELPGGLANVSLEQVLRWDPEVIVTIDLEFAANGARGSAVERRARGARWTACISSPKLPVRLDRFPAGRERLVGLWWLGKAVYPQTASPRTCAR